MLKKVRAWAQICWVVGVALLASAARAQGPLRYDNWRLVQAEEFDHPGDSATVAAHWRTAYPWGPSPGGLETEYYTGHEVHVAKGNLLLTAHRLPVPRAYGAGSAQRHLRYTSGMVYGRHPAGADSLRAAPCGPGEGITYGLFEMRCRLPAATASFPAFWLYGNPDEVDVFESDAASISNNVLLHAHDYWRPGPVEEASCQCFYFWPGASRFTAQYHRYALEWLPGQLTFYFDGVPIRRETRFRPLGCPLTVIANLAQWAWAGALTDTLAIDYIRIYRPRHLPPAPFGSGPGQPLRGGIFNFPRLVAPERSNPLGAQTWQLARTKTGELTLALRDNLNPSCRTVLPLPLGGNWQAPWLVATQATPIVVQLADTAALHWTLLSAQGPVRQQQGQAAASPWQLPTAGLAPGAYQLRLQVGDAVRYQALYVVSQPANSHPTAAWLAPVLAVPSQAGRRRK